jgi:hypothetical protein
MTTKPNLCWGNSLAVSLFWIEKNFDWMSNSQITSHATGADMADRHRWRPSALNTVIDPGKAAASSGGDKDTIPSQSKMILLSLLEVRSGLNMH